MMQQIAAVFTSQIALFVLMAITSILSCRLLGPEQRGVLVVTLFLTNLAGAITCFGLTHSLTYNISRAKDANRALSQAISVSLRLLPCSFVIAAALYLLADTLGRASLLKGLPPGLLLSSYCLYGLTFVQAAVRDMFLGLHNYRWRNIVAVLPSFVIAVLLGVAWLFEWEVTPSSVVSMHIGGTALALVLGAQRLFRRYRPEITLQVPADWLKTHVWFGFKFYVALIAQTLNYRLDNLILSLLAGNLAVGLYSTGVTVTELLLFFPSSMSLVLYPKIASVPAEQRHRLTVLAIGSSLYLVAGAGALLTILSPWIIPLVFGRDFSPAVAAAQGRMPGMLGLTVVNVLCHAFAGSGRPEYAAYTTGVGLIGTVAADLLLIPQFGIVGAAWASSIAYTLAAGIGLVLYLHLARLSVDQLVRDLAVEPVVWLQAKCRAFRAA